MTENIEGKVVVITGASSGLGAAAARLLAAQGAKVVLGARRLDRLQSLAAELGLPPEAAVETDVTDAAQVKALVQAAVERHGRIDVIVNIAAARPHMTRQKSGQIINVSSVAGHKVRAGSAVYAATKAAVRMLSEGLRLEVKPYNIRTTIISPGAVESELPQSLTEPDMAKNVAAFYEAYAIPADSFARMVSFAISQPADVDINEILFRPTAQEL